jgi:hypothetical protein
VSLFESPRICSSVEHENPGVGTLDIPDVCQPASVSTRFEVLNCDSVGHENPGVELCWTSLMCEPERGRVTQFESPAIANHMFCKKLQ